MGSYNPTGGGKGQTDKECFRCGRFGHIRANCRAKTHISGGTPKSAPSGKGVGKIEAGEQEISQKCANCALLLMNPWKKSTETVPQLPPLSCFRETRTCCNGNNCPVCEEPSFFDCWEWKHEQSDTSQQVDPWAQECSKVCVSRAKVCFAIQGTCQYVLCQEVGRFRPTFAKYSSPVRYLQ